MSETISDQEVQYKDLNLANNSLYVVIVEGNKVKHERYKLVKESETIVNGI